MLVLFMGIRRVEEEHEQDQVLYQEEGYFISRRSSLASGDEDELRELIEMSRPGTSISHRSGSPPGAASDTRIQMPHAELDEKTAEEASKPVVDLHPRSEHASHEQLTPVKV
jgi:hypothetical protein